MSGCLSGGAPAQNKAYIAGYFDTFDHTLTFKNLDTQKLVHIKLKAKDEFSLAAIPPGRYAFIQALGSGYKKTYHVDIPVFMRTIITAEPGTITFMGKLSYEIEKGIKLFGMSRKGSLGADYPFEQFKNEYELKYLDSNMTIKPLKLMDFQP